MATTNETTKKPGRQPGTPKTGGRQPGTPNKVTREVKEMILEALDRAGGVEYLVARAKDQPKAFMALVGRVLPLQVTGANGKPLIPESADARYKLSLDELIEIASRAKEGGK